MIPMLTVHEFLYQLVSDPHTRAAFDTDPDGCLHNAGLGELTTDQFIHVASLALDFVPADVVASYTYILAPRMQEIAKRSELGVLNLAPPFLTNDPHDRELTMPTHDIFSARGDIDKMLHPAQVSNSENSSTDNDAPSSDHTGSMNPVASGNEFHAAPTIGNLATTGPGEHLNGLNHSGNVTANPVTDHELADNMHAPAEGNLGHLGPVHGVGALVGLHDTGDLAPLPGGADQHEPHLAGHHGPSDPVATEHTPGTWADPSHLGL